jgi:large subunit ribosomal protein L17
MRHRLSGRHFSRATDERTAMFRIQVTDFLRNGRMSTTVPKAKEVRSIAEKMITLGRGGSLHQRRLAAEFITDAAVVKRLFTDIGPKFKDRNGGYTRITRTGTRKGDAAEMAVLELVE